MVSVFSRYVHRRAWPNETTKELGLAIPPAAVLARADEVIE